MAEPQTNAEPRTDLAGALVSKFDKLLLLIEKQNLLMEKHAQTLDKHTGMLESIEKDATKDDRAHDERSLEDEQTWGALDKESLAKITLMAEGWKGLMNISLIFTALFLTVVTAFISPIIQLFTTPSSSGNPSSPNNPLPSGTTQLVALFYYMAIIISIFNSVLCVLGMQWTATLIAVPIGKTNLERALARERRKVIAERYMMPLMGVLFWTLLLAIGFFVLGFLIQQWELAFSFNGSTPILIIGGTLSTALAIVIVGIIVLSTVHATLNANSPFETPLSHATRLLLAWIRQHAWHSKASASGFHASGHQHGINSPSPRKTEKADVKDVEDMEALIRWDDNDSKDTKALKTYARLVLNTNDPEVLERAVPSFEFGKWYTAGTPMFSVFLAVRERFLATDTSFRVKETVLKQLLRFKDWGGWRDDRGNWRIELREGVELGPFTEWCKAQCKSLIYKTPSRRKEFFSCWVFWSSFEEDNQDLLRDNRSYYESLANVLCCFTADSELGKRRDIFTMAVRQCTYLLDDAKNDEVATIISHVSRSLVLVSLLKNPYLDWSAIREPGSEASGIMYHYLGPDSLLSLSDLTVAGRIWADCNPLGWNTTTATRTFYENHLGCFIPLPRLSDDECEDLCINILNLVGEIRSSCLDVSHFKRPILELLGLDEDQRHDVISRILHDVQRSDLLNLLLCRSYLHWDRIKDVVSYIARGHEFEILNGTHTWVQVLPNDIEHSFGDFHSSQKYDMVCLALSFLDHLMPSLPTDFTLQLDLIEILQIFIRYKRNRRTWRTYSDTLIFYFDHGALALDEDWFSKPDAEIALKFLKLCITKSPHMKRWHESEQTSERSKERATFYLKKMEPWLAKDPRT
ncbi:hypothetical protein SISNIDRAFT_516273 [Sistotremastrum niveocremeum HHB9708]|uniref:DUF6535 domain-containing protein n=1 Tax=Sistotremastrum niveocremeum HHB9708 TaxID=1314777 RepID=A0A164SM67_9AGAM|nr:hypothetical protein SISNIDRAFT_516273 [Sistotremastrum niveocremeum HHB9708]